MKNVGKFTFPSVEKLKKREEQKNQEDQNIFDSCFGNPKRKSNIKIKLPNSINVPSLLDKEKQKETIALARKEIMSEESVWDLLSKQAQQDLDNKTLEDLNKTINEIMLHGKKF